MLGGIFTYTHLSPEKQASKVTLNIIHFNDVYRLSSLPHPNERGITGGAARFTTALH
jgi:hypothetical protein